MAAMAQDDLDRLYNQAREKLTGVSLAALKAGLFDVLHEFFNDSNAWIENVPFTVIAGTTLYDVAPGDSGQIIRLGGVFDPNVRPVNAIMPEIGVIELALPPSTTGQYTACLIKNVKLPLSANGVPPAPDWVLPVFGRTILYGLIGTMALQPNKSYSDNTVSSYHLRKFRDGVAAARVSTLRRNSYGIQAWSYPQTFRVQGQRGGVSVGNDLGFR